MGKLVGLGALILTFLVLGVATVAAAVTGSSGTSADAGPGAAAGDPAAVGPVGVGVAALPPDWVVLERAAAATCPGLSWSVLAAIGAVESDSGRSPAAGVAAGANAAGAEGPMQFEPSTFAAYATVGPGGTSPASPYDVVDAVYTAATMLCADGAGSAGGLDGAVYAYDHSAAYVSTVLTLSLAFAEDPATDVAVAAAIGFAARQLGTPYLWGGNGPGGFDCSGLTRAAYAAAGVPLPRVAQDQFWAGPASTGATVRPGDLVFFGSGPQAVDHVGIYVGDGLMVDAPHTGSVVRLEPADWTGFVGATRPG